ncbi:hypothetical protein SESBI_22380 [Sesbania bispinosa]|nr:hypothetical protein SESBI_22380 [Sesbania bispinosa]
MIFSDQREENPTPPKPPDGGDETRDEPTTHGGGVANTSNHPKAAKENISGQNHVQPEIGAGKSQSMGDDCAGPIYRDWIMVTKNKKGNKPKIKSQGDKGDKGINSQNKFHILGNESKAANHNDNADKEKGKSIIVASSVNTDKAPKTWVRKRPRKEFGEGPSEVVISQAQVKTYGPSGEGPRQPMTNANAPASRPCGPTSHSSGPEKKSNMATPSVTAWPDGTLTSFPLIRISANHFRFQENDNASAHLKTYMEVTNIEEDNTIPK